jgi:hypothetical protein
MLSYGAVATGFAQLHPKKLVENQFVLQALHLTKGIIKNSTIQRVAILIVSSQKNHH